MTTQTKDTHYSKTASLIPTVLEMHRTHRHLPDIVKDTGLSKNTVRAIIRDNGTGTDHAGYTSKTLRLLLSCCTHNKESFRKAYQPPDEIIVPDKDRQADFYYDALITQEYGTLAGLTKVIDEWLAALESLDDAPHTRGAAIALVMFKDYLAYVDSLNPIADESALTSPESPTPIAPPTVREPEPPKQINPKLAPKEIEDYEPGATRATVLGNLTKVATAGKPKPKTTDDYPTPWCTVKNAEGAVLRYEDANGKSIPKELWP